MYDILGKGYTKIQSEGFLSFFQAASRYLSDQFILPIILRTGNKIVESNLGDRRDDLLLFGGPEYGRGNSKYVFEWICRNRTDLSPVWVTQNEDLYAKLNRKGLPVCAKFSSMHLYYLTRAKIGLTSGSLSNIAPSRRSIPESMTLFFLDHGSPVKFGKKMRSNPYDKKREKLDYWIKLSEFHADHRIKYPQTNEPTYLITGFPRNDVLLDSSRLPQTSDSSLLNTDRTTVLYAPTKRSKSRWKHPVRLFPFDDFNLDQLSSFLQRQSIQLLINLHPASMRQLSDPDLFEWADPLRKKIQRLTELKHVYLTSDDTFVHANELMSLSDILITDYSSMYHDYLLLDRPILFIPYDYPEFKQKFGFSYDYYKHLPGPVIESFQEFLDYLSRTFDGEDLHQYDRQKLQRKIHAHVDSSATERVVKAIDAVRKGRPVNSVSKITTVS